MKNTVKIVLFVVLVLAILFILPNISNASGDTVTVETEDQLLDAIADQASTIALADNITLTKYSLEFNYDVTIIGGGYTIIGTDTIQGVSSPSNKSLIVANPGATVTLQGISLIDSPKYGVQAFNGGSVILNGVYINNCAYGGVLINGGTVTVKSLSLGSNGTGSNNGIEMDMGSTVIEPSLIMQGTLSTDQATNVVRILSEANVANAAGTSNKVFVSGNSVLLTDANNNVLAEGAVEGGSVNEDIRKVILTIVANDVAVDVVVDANSAVSKDVVDSNVALSQGQVVDGYYTDADYSTEFNFDTVLTADTTIYAKVSTASTSEDPTTPADEEEAVAEEVAGEGEKDETPKTGVANYIGVAAIVAVLATTAVVTIKRRNS